MFLGKSVSPQNLAGIGFEKVEGHDSKATHSTVSTVETESDGIGPLNDEVSRERQRHFEGCETPSYSAIALAGLSDGNRAVI